MNTWVLSKTRFRMFNGLAVRQARERLAAPPYTHGEKKDTPCCSKNGDKIVLACDFWCRFLPCTIHCLPRRLQQET